MNHGLESTSMSLTVRKRLGLGLTLALALSGLSWAGDSRLAARADVAKPPLRLSAEQAAPVTPTPIEGNQPSSAPSTIQGGPPSSTPGSMQADQPTLTPVQSPSQPVPGPGHESGASPAASEAHPPSDSQPLKDQPTTEGGDTGQDRQVPAAPATAPETATEGLPLDELYTFAEVFGRIKSDYVDAVEDRALLKGAIRGMLSWLDPHSAYLDGEEYQDLQVGTSGEFGGLGIEVGLEDGLIKIIAPIDDTPAQRAGLQAGDLIVRIDNRPVKGMGLEEAVKLMRGKVGTPIELSILRAGTDQPFKVELVRDVIHVQSVKSRLLAPGFGYVRISNFQSRTTEDLLDALASLKAENDGDLKGLVLDLRNNPGGVLNSAVAISDAFLAEGLIVYTKGRVADSALEFKAGPDDVLGGAPLVILVNGGSASASEIVAGALQDHRRAIIMGSQTFGKGSVQTIIPIDDASALKLTTALYYTPAGRSIQAEGIIPDIPLERGRLELSEPPALGSVKEADLARHLTNGEDKEVPREEGQESPEAPKGPGTTVPDTPPKDGQSQEDHGADPEANDAGSSAAGKKPPLAVTDYQLYEALNVLRALTLYSAPRANPAASGEPPQP